MISGGGGPINRAVNTYNHTHRSEFGQRAREHPHDNPSRQAIQQVHRANGQDPGSRRLAPSRTSPESAAPVKVWTMDYNPTGDGSGSGCQSAQRVRRDSRLARRPKSSGSASRRAPPTPRPGIRIRYTRFLKPSRTDAFGECTKQK